MNGAQEEATTVFAPEDVGKYFLAPLAKAGIEAAFVADINLKTGMWGSPR